MQLIHGGNRARASAEFDIPVSDWLDLSTGISPWSWPLPEPVPQAVWQRLPEDSDGLLASASHYYQCADNTLLALPGSQYAISRVPRLLPRGTVALPYWGYREHQQAWQRSGHRAVWYRSAAELLQCVTARQVTHAVVINPNNPSTELIAPGQLADIAAQLANNSGYLVVDEAFMDPHPHHSLISTRPANTIILRSVGKFFGLAGIRLGFMIAEPALLERLAATMDPWAVSHPARWLGRLALADGDWQAGQRLRLETRSRAWFNHLQLRLPAFPWRYSPLFISAETPRADALYRAAGRRGLLLRLHADQTPALIRLGLPRQRDSQHALSLIDDLQGEL